MNIRLPRRLIASSPIAQTDALACDVPLNCVGTVGIDTSGVRRSFVLCDLPGSASGLGRIRPRVAGCRGDGNSSRVMLHKAKSWRNHPRVITIIMWPTEKNSGI